MEARIDARKIAHLESFAAFIEFLTKPDEYRQIINDTRSAIAEWREVNEKARRIKDIDLWQASIKQELERRAADLVAKEEAFRKTEEDAKAARQKSNDARSAEMSKLADKIKVVSAKEAELAEALSVKADLAKWNIELNKKSDALNVMEKDLKDKMAKLSELMAGK